jgi:hypothetical protein
MWEDIGEVEILGNPVDGNTADSAASNPVLKNRKSPDKILPRLSLQLEGSGRQNKYRYRTEQNRRNLKSLL